MENLGLTDFDKKWFDFTSGYVNKLDVANQNWDALTEPEQELAALWKLEMDMYNGGFLEFFCNWGLVCYQHATRCLTNLNATQALEIVTQQFRLLDRLEDDKRLKELWDIPKFLTAEETKKLVELDERYWENTDAIQAKTFVVYAALV